MKAIWNGTDSLFLVRMPRQLTIRKKLYVLSLRIFARLCDFFAQEHYACGELVKRNLIRFGFKKKIILFASPIKELCFDKIPHTGFNVLYYLPNNKPFTKWLYGYDIVEELMQKLNVKFIRVSGDSDMNNIYAITDVYIRPNRHDGEPRMVAECKKYNIPVISTKENPTIEYFESELLKRIP